MINKTIYLIGDGWGAISAFKGLYSKCNLKVLTFDNELKILCKKNKIEIFDDFESFENEYIIFAGYKPIVPKKITERNKAINIHYSLLPKYRGFHSVVWAILNNESELGLTIHEMNEYIDDGDIIHQFKVFNDFKSTSYDYMVLFNKYIENNLFLILDQYVNGKIIPFPQDKKQATWVGKRNIEDCKINFNKPISFQKSFFRALVYPYPLPYFIYKDMKFYVTKVDFHEVNVDTHIGRILNIDNEGIWVKCLDGYLILKEIYSEENVEVKYEYFKIGLFLNNHKRY